MHTPGGFWELAPPHLHKSPSGGAPADSLESACAQKAPLSERCLSACSQYLSDTGCRFLGAWGPTGVAKDGWGPALRPAPRRKPEKANSPRGSRPGRPKGPSDPHTGKHQGSSAVSLGEEMVLSRRSAMPNGSNRNDNRGYGGHRRKRRQRSRVPQGDPLNEPVRWGPGSLVYRRGEVDLKRLKDQEKQATPLLSCTAFTTRLKPPITACPEGVHQLYQDGPSTLIFK